MEKNIQSWSRGSWSRIGAVLGVAALSLGGLSAVRPASGGSSTSSFIDFRLRAREAIEDLTYCYAEATDLIGAGQLEAGRAMYVNECFAPNALIEASFPGNDPNGPPDLTSGPSQWADIANNVFTTNGYVATQHLNSNVRIDIHGTTATMTTYLNAVHVIDPDGSIDLANGTYTDEVVLTPQGWRISKRSLRLITFMRIESPTP